MASRLVASGDKVQLGPLQLISKLRVSKKSIAFVAVLFDLISILISNVVGHTLYQSQLSGSLSGGNSGLIMGSVTGILYAFSAHSSGLFKSSALKHPLRYVGRVLTISVLACLALTALLFILKVGATYSRGAILLSATLQMVMLLAARFCTATFIETMVYRRRIVGRPVVLIGDQDELGAMNTQFLIDRFGLQDVGRVPLTEGPDEFETGFSKAMKLARDTKAEAFVIAAHWSNPKRLTAISNGFGASPLPVSVLPDYTVRAVLGESSAVQVDPSFTIELKRAPMTRIERGTKRMVDIFCSGSALLVLAPFLILCAIAVKIDSPGPAIFRQKRSGFDQHRFRILKFRTMTVLEDGENVTQVTHGDTRVTRLGRFLRRTSIDELPQLINVLTGDMSIIGPRPHAIAHDDTYQRLIETYCFRNRVKPGLTGWAQVNGLRGETRHVEEMRSRIDMDVWYTNNWSMYLDILILFRTFFVVLKQDAY